MRTAGQEAAVKLPAWDSPWNRPLALGELLLQPIMIPLALLWFGLGNHGFEQAKHSLYLLKVIRTGKTGPYRGCSW